MSTFLPRSTFQEVCLQAFETFLYRCTKVVTPFLPQIINITSQSLKYDPNYHYDEEEDDSLNGTQMETDDEYGNGGGDDEGEEEEDNEYSDDDDLSWKVRRAAAKCIEALITYRSDRLAENYKVLGTLLISRFKEREENVKYDIFQAYLSLLKQTKMILPERLVHSQHQGQQPMGIRERAANRRVGFAKFAKVYKNLSRFTKNLPGFTKTCQGTQKLAEVHKIFC